MLEAPRAWTMIGIVVLAGCAGAALMAPRTTLNFVLDAPLCSMSLPVQFSIDSLQVGTDTFRINIPGRNHIASRSLLL